MNRTDWLEQRRTGIGSSDAAAIMGLSRYKTALDVQREKIVGSDEDRDELKQIGLDMEYVILRAYHRRTGVKPRKVHRILRHKKYPWMIASLDAQAGSPSHPLEFKNIIFTKDEFGEEGTDEIPNEYILQTQHQMAVTNSSLVEVPTFTIFARLKLFKVQRNEKLIDAIVEQEYEFWRKHCDPNGPQIPVDPQLDHPRVLESVKKFYRSIAPEKTVQLHPDYFMRVNELEALREEEKVLEKSRKKVEAEILNAMGDAEYATVEDFLIQRKKITVPAHPVDEFSYNRLYIKQGVKA